MSNYRWIKLPADEESCISDSAFVFLIRMMDNITRSAVPDLLYKCRNNYSHIIANLTIIATSVENFDKKRLVGTNCFNTQVEKTS